MSRRRDDYSKTPSAHIVRERIDEIAGFPVWDRFLRNYRELILDLREPQSAGISKKITGGDTSDPTFSVVNSKQKTRTALEAAWRDLDRGIQLILDADRALDSIVTRGQQAVHHRAGEVTNPPQNDSKTCSNCSVEKAEVKGECRRCAAYRRVNEGKVRPSKLHGQARSAQLDERQREREAARNV